MKRCVRCLMPENFQLLTNIEQKSVKLNEKGICNFCENDTNFNLKEKHKKELKKDLEETFKKCKDSGNVYDCVMGLSGGKDSSYLLYLLVKKYKLIVLAVTVDNGFLPEVAINNAKRVSKKLNVEHTIIKLNSFEKVIRYALTHLLPNQLCRDSLCVKCHNAIFSWLVKIAIDKNIALVISGETPRQNPFNAFYEIDSHILNEEGFIPKEFRNSDILTDKEIKDYYFNPKQYPNLNNFPRVLFPYHVMGYNKEEIKKKVFELGLLSKNRLNHTATNCYLGKFMPYVDLYRTNYYSWINDWSFKIRKGTLKRTKALLMLKTVRLLIKLGILWRWERNFCLKKIDLTMKEIINNKF